MQEAFEKILERLDSHIEDAKSEGDFSYIKSFEIAKRAVQEVSKEYNNGWIPCSVEMPKVENLHEISIDNCTGYLVQRRCGLMDVAHYISVYGEPSFEANALKLSDVIAWRTLPPEYQPKGE